MAIVEGDLVWTPFPLGDERADRDLWPWHLGEVMTVCSSEECQVELLPNFDPEGNDLLDDQRDDAIAWHPWVFRDGSELRPARA